MIALATVLLVAVTAYVAHRELAVRLSLTIAAALAIAALGAAGAIAIGASRDAALSFGAIAAICCAIAAVDARERIIPDTLVLALLALAIVAPFAPTPSEKAFGAIVVGGVFLAVRGLHFAIRRVEGLGLGDVKLAVASGALLGAESAFLGAGLAAAMTAAWVVAQPTPAGAGHWRTTEAPLGVGLAAALMVMSAIAAVHA